MVQPPPSIRQGTGRPPAIGLQTANRWLNFLDFRFRLRLRQVVIFSLRLVVAPSANPAFPVPLPVYGLFLVQPFPNTS